jgi:hypothetical protein
VCVIIVYSLYPLQLPTVTVYLVVRLYESGEGGQNVFLYSGPKLTISLLSVEGKERERERERERRRELEGNRYRRKR